MSTYLQEGDHISDGGSHELSYDWVLCGDCEGVVFVLKCSCGESKIYHAPAAFSGLAE
jgi:hypothetical protein